MMITIKRKDLSDVHELIHEMINRLIYAQPLHYLTYRKVKDRKIMNDKKSRRSCVWSRGCIDVTLQVVPDVNVDK